MSLERGRPGGRRLTRGMLMIGLIAISGPPIASPAQAAPDAGVPVTLYTLPSLEGVDFSLAGSELSSNEQGVARATVPPGTYPLRVVTYHKSAAEGLRAKFSRWSDGAVSPTRDLTVSGPVNLQVGFDVDYLVTTVFSDAEGSRIGAKTIDSVTLTDDEGTSSRHPGFEPGLAGPTAIWWSRHPPGTRWLAGKRITESGDVLAEKRASYQAEHAVVDGIRIPASSTSFAPAESNRWPIELEARSVGVEVRDLFLGSSAGSSVNLTYPDGRTRRRRIKNGELSLLPPGSYVASADSAGIPINADYSVPHSGELKLSVITYADIAIVVIVVIGLGALVTAVVLRRRSAAPERVSGPSLSSGPVEPGPVAVTTGTPDPAPAPAWVPEPDAGNGSGPHAPLASESAGEISPPRPFEPVEYVRVTLAGGRSVEGWSHSLNDGDLLLMDVARVRDPEGQEVATTSSDRFLFTSDIVRIEQLKAYKPNGP